MGKEAKYVVRLSDAERQSLQELLAGKRVAADKLQRARVFLRQTLMGRLGRIQKSRMPSVSGSPPSIGCGNGWSKRAWRQRSRVGRVPNYVLRKSMAPKKPISSQPLVAAHRKAALAGLCSCWPTGWWNCNWSIPSASRPCERR